MTGVESDIVIARETKFSEDTIEMILEADAYARSLYPPECIFGFKPHQLEIPQIHFFVARDNGVAVGCAGIMKYEEDPDDKYTEVKRMFVKPSHRGRGLARRLMKTVEDETRSLGFTVMRLETGIRQPEAIALYVSCGFTPRDIFGKYIATDMNVYYEKRLSAADEETP